MLQPMGVLWGWVTQLSGLTSPIGAGLLAAALIIFSAYRWSKNREKQNMPGIQLWQIWAISIIGLWIFVTATLGTWLYTIINPPPPVAALQAQQSDEGPLTWFVNLSITPGPNVIYNFGFSGANTSQIEVAIHSARLVSANTGATLDLKIEAEGTYVEITKINPTPPGAPIRLLADFSPSGISKEQFIKDWSKFTLIVKDDKREYRIPFNEGNIAPFFPGLVGPHVTVK